MTSEDFDQLSSIAEFERRNSPEGLFLRYARGRRVYYKWRQLPAVFALVVFMTIGYWQYAVLGFLAIQLGEWIELASLSLGERVLKKRGQFREVELLTAATAAIQALAVTVAIIVTLRAIDHVSANTFLYVLLAFSSMNGGMVFAYHKKAGYARFFVYFAGALVVAALLFFENQSTTIDLIVPAILAYLVFTIAQENIKSFKARQESGYRIVKMAADLEEAYKKRQEDQAEIRQMALMAEHTSDGVVVMDPDGRVVWCNKGFLAMTGFSQAEILGQTLDALLVGPRTSTAQVELFSEAMRDGSPIRGEILNYKKDGSEIWNDSTISPVLAEGGQVEAIVSVIRDVTEAHLSAETLKRAREAAEKAALAKSQFLANMSHEIRTPMNGIMGMSTLLKEADLAPNELQYAETIYSSAAALLHVINDILDISKIEAGHLSIIEHDFNARLCLSSVVDLLETQAKAKGLYLKLETDNSNPEIVRGDEGRLRQILVNLIGNAIKFTSKGGVVVRASSEDKGDRYLLQFEIVDTGIGIEADMLENVFERFSQAEMTTTRQFGGAGLGLSIARQLARLMNGDITVTSQPGEGSTFTLSIELGHPADEEINLSPDANTVILPEMEEPHELRVLIAEDNAINAMVIEKFFDDMNVELEIAEDGQHALDKVPSFLPDVIFMDMSMPRMDGLQATQEIRKLNVKQPRIIALTANAFESDRKSCLAAGMDDFLSKPLSKSDLLAALTKHAPQMAQFSSSAS